MLLHSVNIGLIDALGLRVRIMVADLCNQIWLTDLGDALASWRLEPVNR